MKKFCEHLTNDSDCMIDDEECEFDNETDAIDLCDEFAVPVDDTDDEEFDGEDD